MRTNIKSWSENFHNAEGCRGHLQQIGCLKIKKGHPMRVCKTSLGFACHVNVGGADKDYFVLEMNEKARFVQEAYACDITEFAYFAPSPPDFVAYSHDGQELYRWANVEACEFGDKDLVILDGTKVFSLKSGCTLDVSNEIGVAYQILFVGADRFVCAGRMGAFACSYNGKSIQILRQIVKGSLTEPTRTLPLKNGGAAIITLRREQRESSVYRIDSGLENCELVANVQLDIVQGSLGGILCSGAVPFKDGFVAYATSRTARADFYFDLNTGEIRRLEYETSGLEHERKVSVGGHLVRITDNAGEGRLLQCLNADFIETSRVVLPFPRPHPGRPKLLGVTPDGDVVISTGKRNQEIVLFGVR